MAAPDGSRVVFERREWLGHPGGMTEDDSDASSTRPTSSKETCVVAIESRHCHSPPNRCRTMRPST